MIKKIGLSMVLFIMATLIFTPKIFANEQDYTYIIEDDAITITGYIGKEKHIQIPNKINGLPVTKIGKGAFANKRIIETVSFPNTLEAIGDYAFSRNRLKSLVLPDSIKEIGRNSFQNNQLTEVKLPSNLKVIPYSTFEENAIKKIQLPVNLEVIGGNAFKSNKLSEINLPESLLTLGEGAFENNRLKNIILPNQLISVPKNAFSNNQLTDISFGENVKEIQDYAFSNNQLNAINLEKFDSLGIGAFSNNKLTSVVLPPSLTNIPNKLFEKNLITEVELPKELKRIGNSAFANNLLTKITLPPQVSVLDGGAFSNNKLKKLTIDHDMELIEYEAFSNNLLEEITIKSKVNNWGYSAFADNPIDRITLPQYKMSSFVNALPSQNNVIKVDGSVKKGHIAWMTDEALTTEWNGEFKENLVIYGKWGAIPEIIGPDFSYVTLGEDFDFLKDVQANDLEDGNLMNAIEIDFKLYDKNKPGDYIIEYRVTDSDGLTGTYTRKLNVNTNTKPVIKGKTDYTIYYGGYFHALNNLKVTDREDGDLLDKVKVTGWNFDTKKTGIYKLTYRVKDVRGNEAVFYRNITVLPQATFNKSQQAATANTITVSWDKAVGASGYEVVLYDDHLNYIGKFTTNKTAYTFKRLNPLIYYAFKVRTYKQIGNQRIYSGYYNVESIVTAANKPKISVKKMKKNYKITWVFNRNASSYKIQYSSTKNFAKGKTKTITTLKPYIYVGSTKNKSPYYVRVQTVKKHQSKSYTSAWSQVKVLK